MTSIPPSSANLHPNPIDSSDAGQSSRDRLAGRDMRAGRHLSPGLSQSLWTTSANSSATAQHSSCLGCALKNLSAVRAQDVAMVSHATRPRLKWSIGAKPRTTWQGSRQIVDAVAVGLICPVTMSSSVNSPKRAVIDGWALMPPVRPPARKARSNKGDHDQGKPGEKLFSQDAWPPFDRAGSGGSGRIGALPRRSGLRSPAGTIILPRADKACALFQRPTPKSNGIAQIKLSPDYTD